MIIQDGTGTGSTAQVNSSNQLVTRSITFSPMHDAALRGDAFSWTAVTADIDATDTALLVANTSSTKYLIIDSIYVWADVPTAIQIHCPAAATWAGTAVVGANLNRANNAVAEATAKADETANTLVAGYVVQTVQLNETTTDIFAAEVDLKGSVILGENDSIAVDVVAESAAFNCTIFGYYQLKET